MSALSHQSILEFLQDCHPKAASQTPEAIHGILLLNSLIPAVGLILLSLAFTIYGLNETICKTMREDLAARREAGK